MAANKTQKVDEEAGFSVAPEGTAKTSVAEADRRRAKLTEHYKAEEKVPMYLSPMYRPYVGNVMRVMINGVSIFFKVDGSTQLIPKAFADEITSRRISLDATIMKQKKMENISGNFENAPGDLKLL